MSEAQRVAVVTGASSGIGRATAVALVSFGPFLAAVVALAVLWWRRDRWRPAFFAGMYFVALLFPVLGFFNVFFFRYSFVGDHFGLAKDNDFAGSGGAIDDAAKAICK